MCNDIFDTPPLHPDRETAQAAYYRIYAANPLLKMLMDNKANSPELMPIPQAKKETI